jgi:hypothetical protein
MLQKALTVGATIIVAILASGGVAQASVDVAPATLFAAPAQPADPEAPAPEDDSDSTSDTESESTTDTESGSTSDTESDSTSDRESDSTSDTESDSTTEPESETSPEEEMEPAPAPAEPAPAAGPLGLIQSLVSSLFG